MRFGVLVGISMLAAPAVASGQRVESRALRQSVEALTEQALQLSQEAAGLGGLMSLRGLSALSALGAQGQQLALLGEGFAGWGARGRVGPEAPPRAWNDQDPADSLYREARLALNRSNYTKAAYLFSQIYDRHPKSSYAPDAYYWEATARYRIGSTSSLRTARRVLELQRETFPDARTREDANDLIARINGQLARRGDEAAATEVRAAAESVAEARSSGGASRSTGGSAGRAAEERAASRNRAGRACREDDDDEKMAALNALLSMDEDRALPILRKVMARRDAGSECLRRKAVFLISQHEGAESESMLLDAVRSDPDSEVKQQAIFWLGQSGGDRAAAAIDSILRVSTDPEVQDKAIFALSQNSSPRALQSLRDFAMKTGAPANLRENAIFWLGQSGKGDNVDFLKSIFRTVREESLKDKIIFSISQAGGPAARQWLTEVAVNAGEDVEIRKKAIFWLGQSNGASSELISLYDRSTDADIKDALIFAYSQRQDRAAADKLIEIARTDKDRELRKKALFWLSQSKDPRVAEILEDILSKP